jgi:hypothetical protein
MRYVSGWNSYQVELIFQLQLVENEEMPIRSIFSRLIFDLEPSFEWKPDKK